MNMLVNGHPVKLVLHPILVHFPIAFYFLEFIILAACVLRRKPEYEFHARTVFWLGYGLMLLAMGAGLFDAGGFDGVRGAVRRHAMAALGVFAIYTLRAVFYRLTPKPSEVMVRIYLAGALLGYAAVILTGFLGGLLVYS